MVKKVEMMKDRLHVSASSVQILSHHVVNTTMILLYQGTKGNCEIQTQSTSFSRCTLLLLWIFSTSMRISNKVGGKEGADDKGQTAHICKLCSNSVSKQLGWNAEATRTCLMDLLVMWCKQTCTATLTPVMGLQLCWWWNQGHFMLIFVRWVTSKVQQREGTITSTTTLKLHNLEL